MGAAALHELAVTRRIRDNELAGSTAAVDAFNWLYRYMKTTVRYTDPAVYTTSDGVAVPNLLGIVRGVPAFFERRLFPVFVFDGGPVSLKQSRLASRRKHRKQAEAKAKAAAERGDHREAARYRAQAQGLTKPIRQTTDELLELLDIPTLVAPSEAEAQAAHMARESAVEYVVTDDYDALLYGTPLTLREFAGDGRPECMDFQATLDEHGLTWSQLVDVAILCGTDYNDGVPGFGPKRALAEVTERGDLESVLAANDARVANATRVRDLFRSPSVTDDYAVERACSPDLDAARAYLRDEWELPESAIADALDRLGSHRDAWA